MPNGVGQVAVISTQPTGTGDFSLSGAMTLGTFQYNNPNSNNGGQPRSLNGSGGVITFQTSSGNALFWMQSGELAMSNLGISFVLNSTTEWRMDGFGEVGGVVSGTGGILKTGAAQLWLNGTNNSYTGLNTISGGYLTGISIANNGVNSSYGRGNFSMSNGGTLQYFGATASTDRTFSLGTGGGVIDLFNASGTSLTLTGIVSGSGSLTFNATSGKTLVLSGNNSYTGGTFIQGGTIQLGASERLSNTGDLTIASNSTFDLSTFNETVRAVQGNGSGVGINGTGTLTASSFTFDGGGVTANLAGSASLTKNSTNTLILTGANTYSGGTFITGGTLSLVSSERLANSGSITISNGATLQLGGTETVGSVSMTSGTISSGSLVGTAYNFDSGTVSSNLGGSAALTKNGTGTLTLSGTSTFTGGTAVNQGTLQLNAAASLSGSTVNNGIVRFQQGTTATFGGTISGTGSLEKLVVAY
ncbi:MAG: autotransporter-associated beta strand repeat-containing protein [Pirellulales bacterium]